MDINSVVELDINGQETFWVNMKIFASFSGRLRKFFSKSTNSANKFKVIFHDFPCGAGSFELVAKFCYNNGRIDITPSNILLLHFAANFMEMNEDCYGMPNLIDQTKKYMASFQHWSWSELLVGLRQCQDYMPISYSSPILQKLLDILVGRLAYPDTGNSRNSSSESSKFRHSGDLSYNNMKNTSWWFQDLVFFNPFLLKKMVETMWLHKINHAAISAFLIYYQKWKFLVGTPVENPKIIETVITLLHSLDENSISCRGLFDTLFMSLNLKIGGSCRSKLEGLIGSRLHQATLDDLIVPSPSGKHYVYDVNLILRLLKIFLLQSCITSFPYRLKKVSLLMDLYIAEVAPDPCLKSSKFLALVTALPDFARDCHDGIYKAVDIYLAVHDDVSEEKKISISCALDYDKLTSGTLKELAQNVKFPPCAVVTALVTLNSKFKILPKVFINNSQLCYDQKGSSDKVESDPILIRKKRLTQDEKLRVLMQANERRVVDLEKVYGKLHTQSVNKKKSRLSRGTNVRSLPRLCR